MDVSNSKTIIVMNTRLDLYKIHSKMTGIFHNACNLRLSLWVSVICGYNIYTIIEMIWCAPTQGIWSLYWWCWIRISFCFEFWTWSFLLCCTIADNKDEIPCLLSNKGRPNAIFYMLNELWHDPPEGSSNSLIRLIVAKNYDENCLSINVNNLVMMKKTVACLSCPI